MIADPRDGGTITLKGLMEVYDETTHTYVINFQGDPRYTPLKFTVRFFPGPSTDTSTLTWFLDYTPISSNAPAPDNLVDVVRDLFENFASHADAHFANQAKTVNSDPNSGLVVSSVKSKKSRQNELGIAGLKVYSEYDALINQSPGVCLLGRVLVRLIEVYMAYYSGISVRFSNMMFKKHNTGEIHPHAHTSYCSAMLGACCASAADLLK